MQSTLRLPMHLPSQQNPRPHVYMARERKSPAWCLAVGAIPPGTLERQRVVQYSMPHVPTTTQTAPPQLLRVLPRHTPATRIPQAPLVGQAMKRTKAGGPLSVHRSPSQATPKQKAYPMEPMAVWMSDGYETTMTRPGTVFVLGGSGPSPQARRNTATPGPLPVGDDAPVISHRQADAARRTKSKRPASPVNGRRSKMQTRSVERARRRRGGRIQCPEMSAYLRWIACSPDGERRKKSKSSW